MFEMIDNNNYKRHNNIQCIVDLNLLHHLIIEKRKRKNYNMLYKTTILINYQFAWYYQEKNTTTENLYMIDYMSI